MHAEAQKLIPRFGWTIGYENALAIVALIPTDQAAPFNFCTKMHNCPNLSNIYETPPLLILAQATDSPFRA